MRIAEQVLEVAGNRPTREWSNLPRSQHRISPHAQRILGGQLHERVRPVVLDIDPRIRFPRRPAIVVVQDRGEHLTADFLQVKVAAIRSTDDT